MVDSLSQLIAQYGYLAIAAGCFFEGETAVLLGMVAAHKGILVPGLVWLAATLGTIAGDNIWFHVGKRMGRPALARRPHWHARPIGRPNGRPWPKAGHKGLAVQH